MLEYLLTVLWIVLCILLTITITITFYYLGKSKSYTEVYEKKTPMNIRKVPFRGEMVYVGECAHCLCYINHIENKYCGNCGQKQDWSETE